MDSGNAQRIIKKAENDSIEQFPHFWSRVRTWSFFRFENLFLQNSHKCNRNESPGRKYISKNNYLFFYIYYNMWCTYQCKYPSLYSLLARSLRANILGVSRSIFFMVWTTDKNEGRVLRGFMPIHIQTKASKKGPRTSNRPKQGIDSEELHKKEII